MLNNLKIGLRLGAGFAITLVLLILVSVIGISRINQINDEINSLVKVDFPKTIWTGEIDGAINTIARRLRNSLLFSGDEARREIEAVAEQRKIISDAIDKLDKAISSDEGRAALGKLKTAREAYVLSQNKFIELQKNGKRDEAIAMLSGEMRATQAAYLKTIADLNTLQNNLVNKRGDEANALAQQSGNLLTGLAVVASVLAILFGFLITRSITRPVGEAVQIADKIAEGDFSVKIDSSAKDEVGQVLAALARAVEAVRNMSAEASRLAQAAVDGKLSTRADATQYKGEYQKIVSGVNNTLDAVIGPLNVAANYVDRISKGDIPAKITDT